MINTFLLTLNIIIGVGSLIALLCTIDMRGSRTNLIRLITGILVGLSIFFLPLSAKNFNYNLSVYKQQLLESGKGFYLGENVPYNVPIMKKKVIIRDGEDFSYFEILDKK